MNRSVNIYLGPVASWTLQGDCRDRTMEKIQSSPIRSLQFKMEKQKMCTNNCDTRWKVKGATEETEIKALEDLKQGDEFHLGSGVRGDGCVLDIGS